ncbi:hypothetical protein L917_20249 [Phytophthora nicotianae]|uniref:Uncharacterized protein n=1 Tax=Phytophthora nicotianae TaxID=4792 RepID=W2HV50_PHYNI|nr:hypothetical protein L915_20507 [Phytophthora nicotianae]ETL25849.1 hypothetical protein L916_20365 [Phytophthora nicotianae]ETL79050.1 hypothetical protein L917_20249 [Phytophthora nicotianae]
MLWGVHALERRAMRRVSRRAGACSTEASGELRFRESGAAAAVSDVVSTGGDGLHSREREETGRFLRTGAWSDDSAQFVQSKQETAHAGRGPLFVDDVSSQDVEKSSGSIVFGGEGQVSVKLATDWRLPWHEMKSLAKQRIVVLMLCLASRDGGYASTCSHFNAYKLFFFKETLDPSDCVGWLTNIHALLTSTPREHLASVYQNQTDAF